MKLHEIQELTESELSTLNEQIGDDLKNMIQQQIGDPMQSAIDAISNKLIDKVAPKLKSWALENIQQAKKFGYSTAIISKIISNPEKVTRQLITNALKQSSVN